MAAGPEIKKKKCFVEHLENTFFFFFISGPATIYVSWEIIPTKTKLEIKVVTLKDIRKVIKENINPQRDFAFNLLIEEILKQLTEKAQ